MTLDAAPTTKPEKKKGKAGAVGSKKRAPRKSVKAETASAGQKAEVADKEQDHSSTQKSALGLQVFRATRPAHIEDIRAIAHEFHEQSRWGHLKFSDQKFDAHFLHGIKHPEDTLGIYIQHNGETVGLLHAGAGDYYMGEGGRMITVYILYVRARLRETILGGKVAIKLLRVVGDWAKVQKAEELHIQATSGIDPERTDQLMRKLGFQTTGGNYVGRVG